MAFQTAKHDANEKKTIRSELVSLPTGGRVVNRPNNAHASLIEKRDVFYTFLGVLSLRVVSHGRVRSFIPGRKPMQSSAIQMNAHSPNTQIVNGRVIYDDRINAEKHPAHIKRRHLTRLERSCCRAVARALMRLALRALLLCRPCACVCAIAFFQLFALLVARLLCMFVGWVCV